VVSLLAWGCIGNDEVQKVRSYHSDGSGICSGRGTISDCDAADGEDDCEGCESGLGDVDVEFLGGVEREE
jgi:hypothetical protein